jgi:hypothetical protein
MKKMKILSKKVLSTIAILMVLSFVVTMIALPSINAQTNDLAQRDTFPFVDAVPKITGVGQYTLINYGLLNYLRSANDGWNITVKITDPDGITETFQKMTWSTGMGGMGYIPTKEGDYILQVTFDGVEYYASTSGTTRAYFKPSESTKVTLQVLADYVPPSHPGYSSSPTEYWTRPIDSQLRDWYSIAGSWLVQKSRVNNMFAPYNDAPETAHILWSTPDDQYTGGLAGGYDSIGFQHGDAYEGKFSGAVIVAGVLYYNVAPIYSGGTNGLNQRIKAIDLHTGKTLWERSLSEFGTTARLTRAQIVIYMSLNNRGAWGYLWIQNGANGNTWWALDPKTGEHIYTMTDVPGGEVYYGGKGEMLKYQVVNIGTTEDPSYVLRQWNSTRVVTGDDSSGGGATAWGSQVNQANGPREYNGTRGNQFEIALPRNLGAPVRVFPEDRAIFANVSTAGVTLSAVSLDENNFGRIMFNQEYWQPSAGEWEGISIGGGETQTGWAAFSSDPYVGVFWTKENRVNYVFSLETGKLLWQSESQIYADAWGGATSNSSPEKVIVYGKLIEASVGGIVYCYDAKTGDLLWTHEEKDPYLESYVTENWWLALLFASDRKIYFGHYEHSAQEPKPRGAPFFALDIETGKIVWEITGAFRQLAWGGRAVIGDSIIATMDSYDSQIYAIGKGPSAMTVSAPDVGIAVNTPVMIKGTIMDVSPGTQNDKLQTRFPNGVPAVADESMSEWMLYVYKQFPQPMASGVSVRIDAIDPNNNYVTLGNTVSDMNGRFALEFAPKTEGQYTIYAIFDGTASYYGTTAQNEMTVMAAAAANSTPRYELYIIVMGIAIIITVIIASLLILKKK